MPPEPRRVSRKATNDDDVELKRARGEISCAECRRLKLKCDKKIPCGSCVRRGCTTICPNGSLSAGQGTRFVLADTEQLHRKISEMSERIRQLEDALAIFQAGVSSERHPLLRDELLTIKFGPEVRRTVDDEHSRNVLSQTIDALGTLTIGAHGETMYIGRSGGSETLFLVGPSGAGEGSTTSCYPEEVELDVPELDWDLEKWSYTFPFNICSDDFESFMDKLEAHLPPQPRAWALCETYLEQFSWWFRPIKREELIDEILTPIYRRSTTNPRAAYHRKADAECIRCPHLLATLFMVFAVGALVDLTLPPCSVEAEKYYRLGRAALNMRSIFDSPELETVQAISLMAGYQSLCTSRYTLESAWALLSLASKIGQSIGLHRDSAAWKLEEKIVQRRRNLFWEMYIFEMMHSIALGRPMSVAPNHIDCEPPNDDEASSDEGHNFAGYWKWKFLFSHSVYMHITDALLSAKAPTYEHVLDLDRRIRQTTLPAVKLYLKPDEQDYANPALCMKGWLMSQFRSIAMIYIHRTFFAQALLDNPDNPLSSPYAPSFLAANRCASVLIKSFIHHFERCPDLCGRFWGIWTHTFSACIILGTTVFRSPGVSMAASALIELELVLEIFAKGAEQSTRARQAYGILRDLKSKADKSYNQHRNRHASPTLDIQLNLGPEAEITASRLAIFGGQTRVMSSKLLTRRRKPKPSSISTPVDGTPSTEIISSPSTSSADSPPRDTSPGFNAANVSHDSGSVPRNVSEAFAKVHPSLVEYLSIQPQNSTVAILEPMQGAFDSATPITPTTSNSTVQSILPEQNPIMVPASYQGMNTAPLDATAAFPQFFGANPQLSPQAQFAQPTGIAPVHPLAYVTGDGSVAALTSLAELGFTEDVIMSDHWMSLMRQAGIFDNHATFSTAGTSSQTNGNPAGYSTQNSIF
ncbi:fungal-specific transcription factor domain-containing protein [Irpex rosettiformis]|uniref:Fungal-specific transcription factor domain-containing protein n=1 Tax=Irpex rosettiformis TaxID=378272 RepID=A0ACB8UBC2_9APHY|nr:fungal-specific transcription factor domain-containing protein [Irpex rosettiformis]